MSIDGIGGGAPPGGIGGPSGPSRPGSKSFEVEAPEGADGPDRVGGSEDLGRLERGEISVDEYLDGRVADAVRHLEGKLSSEELDFVRGELRAQLGEDPVLVELVRRATDPSAIG